MSQHVDPRVPFFITISTANADGTIDPEMETPTAYATEQEATEAAKEEADEHGSEIFVYRLTPVYRVHRVAVQVERIPEMLRHPQARGETP